MFGVEARTVMIQRVAGKMVRELTQKEITWGLKGHSNEYEGSQVAACKT